MEINTEMNRVFGTEMAKLFASTISEEELKTTADNIWKELNKSTDSWGSRKRPEIENLVREQIMNRLYEKIEAIMKEPINDELLEKKAREMVETARKVGEDAIIKDMAYHMTENMLSVYGRREEIVREVLYQINVQRQNDR